MPAKEPGFVKELALEGWRDMRSRPLMLLIVSASTLPFVFLLNFVISSASAGLDLALFFSGYAICFALYFLFWGMAVILYNGQSRQKGATSYRDAFNAMESWAWPCFLTGLVAGLVSVIAFMIAQLAVGLLLSFLVAGQSSPGRLIALSYIHFYLSYLAADLAIVFIVLVPQMLQLERGRRVEEVLRASYQKIKEKYREAFFLFIIPELVTRTLLIGALFLISRVPGVVPIFILLLLSMAILEGGKTAFVAAAFNHFYYYLLEEEKQKRKAKPKKQPQKQAKRR